jgi:hypothetical protein
LSIIPFRLLTVLLAATPVLAIAEGLSAQHLIALVTAIMLAVAAMAPQAEIKTTIQLLKRFLLAMLFPVVWMVLQTIPLPFASLVNPIWSTASAALNEPSLWGHISIDPGATFRSLISYATMLSLVIATIIVARDRQRAETTLFVVSAVTAFMAVEVLLNRLSSFAGIIPVADTARAATFVAASALGVLGNTATLIRAVERHLSRRELEASSSPPPFLGLALGLAGIALCLAAMWTIAPGNVLIATAVGLAIMLFIVVVRRFAFRPWTAGILMAIFAAMAIGIATQRFQSNPSAGILGFATSAPAESLALAQRALSDARWSGSGVGTFSLLARVYQDFGTPPISEAPTTAASIAIEWGWAAFVIVAGFAAQLFAFTFRGAVRRGRDSFFPAAAAAGIAVMFCEAFCDPSLLHPAVQIITAVMVGLGISQSVGRTSGL